VATRSPGGLLVDLVAVLRPSITEHNTPAPLSVIAFWHDNPPPKAAGWTKVPDGANGALAAFRKGSVVSP